MIKLDSAAWSAKMQRRRSNLYPAATRHLVREVIHYAKQRAIEQSSFRKYVIGRWRKTVGIVGLKEVKRVYPYSVNLPKDSGPTRDHEINMQSKEYNKSWYIRMRTDPSGSMAGIGNRARHAQFLHRDGGTKLMRERRITHGITMITARRSFRHHQYYYHTRALGQLPV